MLSARTLIYIITLFVFLTGITWVSGDAGQGVAGRLSFADIFGLLIVLFFLFTTINQKKTSFRVPIIYRMIIPLLIVFFVSSIFATFVEKAFFELIIHTFSILVSLSIYNLLSDLDSDNFKKLLQGFLFAYSSIAIIGLLHFFIFPSWFSGAAGGLSGTFRNTGQAGAFFALSIGIIIPCLLSGLIKPTPINIALTFLIFLALIFTFKRAGLVGLGVGCILLLFRMLISNNIRDKSLMMKLTITSIILIPLIVLAFNWGLENIDSMRWRFESKFASDSVEDFRDGFLNSNITYAIKAFEISPFLGVGLGNIAGVITDKYEIHSTYLAILGTSGILGLGAYFLFVFNFLSVVSKNAIQSNDFSRFLYYLFPFLIGFFISWSYTYHLRKREFWVLIFIISLATLLSKREHLKSV